MSGNERTYADTIDERLGKLRDVMERRAKGEVVELFVPTGLRDWDERGGLERGILTVIGAATGEGKSVVKLQLASAAAQRGYRVLMVDFEDPAGKTADRSLSTATGLDNRSIGTLALDDFDLDRLERAAEEIKKWGSRIRHHTGLVDTEACLNLMRSSKWDLILVDYAQAFPEDEGSTVEATIRKFAWDANVIAQEQEAAVVVFSQIKAEVEARGYRIFEQWRTWGSKNNPDKPDISGFCPTGLTDLAWAKGLGDRAKAIMYLWRPGRIALRLGFKVKDDRLRIITAKSNFSVERDLEFQWFGATSELKDLKSEGPG